MQKELKDILDDDDLELSQSQSYDNEEEDQEEVEEDKKEETIYKLFNPASKSIYLKSDMTFRFSLDNKEITLKGKEQGICFKCSCLDNIIVLRYNNNCILQMCDDCISKFI